MTTKRRIPARSRGKQEVTLITDTLKVRRIKEVLRNYYRPPDERIIAPETIIERINRIVRE